MYSGSPHADMVEPFVCTKRATMDKDCQTTMRASWLVDIQLGMGLVHVIDIGGALYIIKVGPS